MTADKRSGEEQADGAKKAKIDFSSRFAEGLFDKDAREQLKTSIAESEPYKHGVIRPLIDDGLLREVRKEIMSQLHFTRKETDIYKVNQTGDLANLEGLDADELSKLSSLAKLKEAMYSKEFRDLLSYVTQSGPLSGRKQDMSINLYTQGCHLLNHDDVIGSRRISYILYLTDPDEPWKPQWGGGLRLYPTLQPNIPDADFSLSIPPQWNQLSFFHVQPGHSFHDVEEVYVDKERLSISGWFHIPQEGEDGFVPGELEATLGKSSLSQLESAELLEWDLPKRAFADYSPADSDAGELSDKDVEYLSQYIEPAILRPDSLKQLNDTFCDESVVEIRNFLKPEYADAVRKAIDVDDLARVPKTSKEISAPWKLARPPHKFRYLYVDDTCDAAGTAATETAAAHTKLDEIRQLFKHASLGRLLKRVSSLEPKAAWAVARRFRPGHDYTLATVHESTSSLLEGVLSLTPSKGWGDGEVGGYDLSMAAEDEGDADPAVYRAAAANGDDDNVLITAQADWNTFTLFLRDSGILRFVKYVSRNAPGSRWDVSAEWTVDDAGDDGDDDDDDTNDNNDNA